MADGQRARYFREHVLGKNVGHRAHGLVRSRSQPGRSNNPCRFLPAMLQGMQTEVRQFLRLRMREDRHHTALVMKFVGNQHLALSFSFYVNSTLAPVGTAASAVQSVVLCVPQCPLWGKLLT